MERETVKLLDVEIDTFNFDEAVEYAKTHYGHVVTINPEMFETASKNPEFARILSEAVLVIPDGIGVEIGLKILGCNVKRIAGIEFARKLIDVFAEENRTIALVGAKSHIIEKAAQNLNRENDNINIVYIQDGYFKDTERVLNELKEKSPSLLLAALGSPYQEEFIYKAKQFLPETLMIGVGGSFDVWSGEVQRAPEIYQKLGLEWLYRTIKEPKRFKRIFPALPMFIIKVLNERFLKGV